MRNKQLYSYKFNNNNLNAFMSPNLYHYNPDYRAGHIAEHLVIRNRSGDVLGDSRPFSSHPFTSAFREQAVLPREPVQVSAREISKTQC